MVDGRSTLRPRRQTPTTEPVRLDIEIDPHDPDSTPTKSARRITRTPASPKPTTAAIVYTGDDEIFQHLYKFVSARRGTPEAAGARSTRERCVARFNDGSGVSSPRRRGRARNWVGARCSSTPHGAAAAVGAPRWTSQWVAVHPFRRPRLRDVHQQHLANGGRRCEPSIPEPLRPHPSLAQHRQVDHGSETFVWSVFALAGAGLGTGDGRRCGR